MKRKNGMKVALRRGIGRAFALAPLVFLTVAGAGCPSLFESSTQRAAHVQQAVPGRDGDLTVATATTVVNAYAALDASTNPIGGTSTTITVANIATLNAGNALFTTNLGQGDLILIIQMAGATINTSETTAYGSIANAAALANAGRYEFVGVEGVSGNVITLACALKNSYTGSGKVQVIRVPQYGILTINNGAKIIARAWNGTVGGVVALHAENTVHLNGNGSIDVSGMGFRGGVAHDSAGNVGTAPLLSAASTEGAEKGESIAGYQLGYGRGAPANGGGGGDAHNGGGGGGANARSGGTTWSGLGVMVVDSRVVGGAQAWPLDPDYALVSTDPTTASPGGGRGGYSWSNAAQSPLTSGPTATYSAVCAWGGDCRRNTGGLGGHPLDNNPTSAAARLFLGGGGGAGDGNNGVAGDGGNGGGLIFVIAGTIDGSGALVANGALGGASHGAAGSAGDGAGGGGGGGTVVVHASAITGTWTISANGGAGGDHTNSLNQNEVEGPGGGGGGGYIAVSGGTPAQTTAAGGLGGTTTVRPSVMSTFPCNGATAGNAGQTNGDASIFLYCGTSDGPVTTIHGPPAFSNVKVGSFTFTNTQTPVKYECKLEDTGSWAPCNASYATLPLADGKHILYVRSTNLGNVLENPPAQYPWTIDTKPPVTTIDKSPTNPSPIPTGTFTFTNTESSVTYECKLDNAAWAPCNSDPTIAAYTTPPLGDGPHTLTVRSTDQAKNVEPGPPYNGTYSWIINGGELDAGNLDGSAALDGGTVFLDAEGVDQTVDVGTNDDVAANNDVAANKDVAGPDLAPDIAIVIADAPPSIPIDSRIDQGSDLAVVAFDAQPIDSQKDGAGLGDTLASGAEPGPDALVPEPNRDSAVVVVSDAAVIKKDAAQVSIDDVKVLGSGFCTIVAPGAEPRAPILLVGLALVGLLLRRRRS